jgi:hypothetical protein
MASVSVSTMNRSYLSESPSLRLGKPENFGAILWATRSFYEKYDRPEVRLLCKPEVPGGFVLTWAHTILLISMGDEDRLEFQEKCQSKKWSSKELRQWIKGSRDPLGQGGRRFQKPKDVESALRQLILESRTWDRRYTEVWFHVDEPAIRLESRKYKSQEVAELAAEAVDVLETLQFNIENCLPQLKQLAAWHKKKVKRRATKKRR